MFRPTLLTGAALSLVLMAPANAQDANAQEENDQEVLTGEAAYGGWEDDAPGVRRHIMPDDLPPDRLQGDPEDPDYEHAPSVVDRPDDTMPQVPEGFAVEEFATDLGNPRVIRIAPNGDIFVADSEGGRVLVFGSDSADDLPAEPEVFAEGLDRPFGMAFYPADAPEYIYIGESSQVVRFPYGEGDREAGGEAEVIVPDIPTERHWTRDVVVAPDGEHLFVSIGSASNVAAEMSEKTEEEIAAHEEEHGRGAAWDDEEDRAVVRIFDAEGEEIENYATGLRNCSGMTIQPETDMLWCTGNERDHVGADVAPDYLTTVEEGGFYGWPWYYTGGKEDPAHAGERPDLQDESITPDVLLQAHSSTMQLDFYDADAFPEEYHGDAFAALRGSWNREFRTGYKIVRALMEDGEPTGVYEDFMTGFVIDEDTVWGRPTGVAVAADGALLVADDTNGTMFRVTHEAAQE